MKSAGLREFVLIGILVCLGALLASPSAQAAFGVASVTTTARNENGTLDLTAGDHPFAYSVSITMNQNSSAEPEGILRNLVVNLPPGVVGDPLALPRCPVESYDSQLSHCRGNSQVGVAHIKVYGQAEVISPIYNLVVPPGSPAAFGFTIFGQESLQLASVRTGGDYGVTVADSTIPSSVSVQSITETFWGVPAAEQHDPERTCNEPFAEGCSSGLLPAPFLTLPTRCDAPLQATVEVESIEQAGLMTSPVSAFSAGPGGEPTSLIGCSGVPFEPSLTARPESGSAESPTGLQVDLHLPQEEEVGTPGTADLKKVSVTLPAGLAVNPSSADGLGACSPSQIDLSGSGPAQCPEDSKIGTVKIDTPLLENPLPGSVYLARQTENPFGSLLALYIAAYDPQTGVVVKLAGKVTPDPQTGRLTATFDQNPQLPFEDLEVGLVGGSRATLTTPSTCGRYTTETDMQPWTSPQAPDVHPTDAFSITSGAGGGACAPSAAQLPNSPSFEAGTTSPLAGAYSPFVLKLSRENGTQRISTIDTTLPEGLLGRLAGIPYCSDAAIAAATARSAPGEGAVEKANPSCPFASQVGTVSVGAGSGAPYYVQGNAYLAGPYKGAPLSLAIITPAVAGPIDLGNVVVRIALYVDQTTTQINAVSDPLPTILQGIPLDIRSVALNLNKPSFTLNPTDCEAKQITGTTTSTTGASAPLTNHFQVGGCKGLDFLPRLALRVFGKPNRNSKPRLRAVLQMKSGEANITRAQVNLPHSEFLEQGHIKTVCTRVQFAEAGGHGEGCPKGSIYGKARAFSPLLEKPLEGPVYLRSSSHKLPDLVAALNGQIDIALDAKIDSGANKGLRTTFEVVPDAPVSKFILEMKGGKKGLLVNSENLCSKGAKTQGIARFTGQNGKVESFKPQVANSCGKQKPTGKKGTGKKHE